MGRKGKRGRELERGKREWEKWRGMEKDGERGRVMERGEEIRLERKKDGGR